MEDKKDLNLSFLRYFMDRNLQQRFWEIDFLRGIAIIMMVLYHLLYNLHYFAHYNINVYSGFWMYFARTTATTFIFLVGVSLSVSFSRTKKIHKDRNKLFMKYLRRGLKVFSWGLTITLVTRIFLGKAFVIFGILHLIGISIILAYPFLKLRYWNLLIGFLCIFLGAYLKGFSFDFYWLSWLGFRPAQFYSVDYFPLLPWFGVVLMGIFFGNLLYSDYSRRFQLVDLSFFSGIKVFCFLGEHSLLIYLLHHPLIIAVLYLLGMVNMNLF
ncbi:MAG: heparan-alpha-glucosaminide N-acetyltransferase [Atribacterota bacterium]